MTRTTNARLAGSAFLLYIATGLTSLVLTNRTTGAVEGAAAKLAAMAAHPTTVRVTVVLTLLCFVYAVVLAVTLRALTRDEDPDLAMIALCCRVSEGVTGAVSAVQTLELLSIATAAASAAGPDAAAASEVGGVLLKYGQVGGVIPASCFAVGGTLFAWLFLRARSIPVPLAWLGVVGSALLLVALPAQILGFIERPVTDLVWIPVAIFEVVLALWLIIKGVPAPAMRT